MGRQTAMADRPTRVVSMPLSRPSPSRADSLAAMPWPTTCCTMLSPTAMPPVTARWAPTERASLRNPRSFLADTAGSLSARSRPWKTSYAPG